MLRQYTHVSAWELSLFSYRSWWVSLDFWIEFVIHNWDTLESLVQSLPVSNCIVCFTNAEHSGLSGLTKCLYALLPRVLLQRRSFLTAWFGWFLSKASATEPGIPGRLPERRFLCLRGCYRMDCRRLIEFGSDRSAF